MANEIGNFFGRVLAAGLKQAAKEGEAVLKKNERKIRNARAFVKNVVQELDEMTMQYEGPKDHPEDG